MFRSLLRISKNQKGILLTEVMVVVAITGLIGSIVASGVYQLISINSSSMNRIVAVKQVERAVHWLNRDTQMAQVIQVGGGSGFPLNLIWVGWDNTGYQVTYALQNGELLRTYSVTGEDPIQHVVAQDISMSAGDTNCAYAGGVFTLKVTAFSSGYRPSTETRTIQVIPRSAP